MRDLLIKADWFEQLQNAPENVQQELFYRIIKYGCLEKDVVIAADDWSVGNAWLILKGHIDRMKDAQDRNIENGRKILGDPQEIYNYCQGHPKAKVDEVGIALGLPKTNAAKGPYAYIYDNPGWKSVRKWHFLHFNFANLYNFVANSANAVAQVPKRCTSLSKPIRFVGKCSFQHTMSRLM